MNLKTQAALMVLAIGLVAGCSVSTPIKSPLASPLRVPASRSPLATPSATVIPFRLDKPIVAGSTKLSGSGQPGVPIVILDVTFMGAVLGTGTVNADGRFSVDVPSLESGHMVGLSLGELAGTQWKPEDLSGTEYRGEGATQIPQVGFFHDTATVVAK